MKATTRFCLVLLVAAASFSSLQLAEGKIPTPSAEKDLIGSLLKRYAKHGTIGRPVNSSSKKLLIVLRVQLIQLLELDMNSQILRTNCWLDYVSLFCNYLNERVLQEWIDELLQWQPEKYNNITQIRIFPSQIWTPDINMYNFADDRLKEKREARLIVNSVGKVSWVPQALFKSTCNIEFQNFPFDVQYCMLEFGSSTHDITLLDITMKNDTDTLDYSDYVESNEWLTDFEEAPQEKLVHDVRTRRMLIGDEWVSKEFRVIRYVLRLRRNYGFFMFTLIIPSVLLSTLTMVVFWLPPESPAKMMLGMNIFVAFFVILVLLSSSMPRALKTFPLIGSYFCFNMIMITVSTFLATLVINLYYRGAAKGHVPKLVRRVLIDAVGRWLYVSQFVPLPESGCLDHLSQANLREQVEEMQMAVQTRSEAPSTLLTLSEQYTSLERNVRELKRFIRIYVNRQKEKRRKNMVAMEWRTLALVLDRIFFVFYIISIASFCLWMFLSMAKLVKPTEMMTPEERARALLKN